MRKPRTVEENENFRVFLRKIVDMRANSADDLKIIQEIADEKEIPLVTVQLELLLHRLAEAEKTINLLSAAVQIIAMEKQKNKSQIISPFKQ